jgi:hypothetical protein
MTLRQAAFLDNLDVDLDPRKQAAGLRTERLLLITSKRMVHVQVEVQVQV